MKFNFRFNVKEILVISFSLKQIYIFFSFSLLEYIYSHATVMHHRSLLYESSHIIFILDNDSDNKLRKYKCILRQPGQSCLDYSTCNYKLASLGISNFEKPQRISSLNSLIKLLSFIQVRQHNMSSISCCDF
jgi:hypothetical protein